MPGPDRRRRALAVVVALAAAGGAVVLLPGTTEAASGATPRPTPGTPHVLRPLTATEEPPGTLRVDAAGTATLVDTNTECGAPAADPVPDGQDIVVKIGQGPAFVVGRIDASWWAKPPYGDATWQLQLRGFMWLQPLARRAYQDGQTQSMKTLVDQVLAFHRQNPDPGAGTATSKAKANASGWDEGTALRRLGAENCLYSLTHDARIAAVMAKDVNVQFGPRYYGPPSYIVHNHGVMADLAVVRAADLVGRADWSKRSISRLVANAAGPWTPVGTSIEQSSGYHLFNVALWHEVVDMLGTHGVAASSVQRVRDLVARADRVSPWLTEPDGHLVVLGDSTAAAGVRRSLWTGRTFRDDRAGLGVGRWSWTDSDTSYYTIRYGPRRTAHGQQERAGVTWSTGGRRVLVGPGKAPYDAAGNYRAWGGGPRAHNVAIADHHALDLKAAVALKGRTIRASSHSWTTEDRLFGVRHVRQYSIVRGTRTLVVKDTYDGRAALHQFWHLDPSWTLVSRSRDGKRLTFRSGTRSLTVTTTGVATVLRGISRPLAGWNFPDFGTRVPANEIQVRAAGTATTTFALR